MSHQADKYQYGGRTFDVSCAKGVEGVLTWSCGQLLFRVYDEHFDFVDYDIRHDDLRVTVSDGALASFYRCGEDNILDHSPQVLGLEKALS